MNPLTHATRALSLTFLLAIAALAGGCAVGTDSTDEPAVTDAAEGDNEAVGEAQDELSAGVHPNCGYCMLWSQVDHMCYRNPLSVCAIPGEA